MFIHQVYSGDAEGGSRVGVVSRRAARMPSMVSRIHRNAI